MRRLLTQGAISVDSRLGRFVGLAAYEAAGGTVRCDLFSLREDGFMDDAALIRRLAIGTRWQNAARNQCRKRLFTMSNSSGKTGQRVGKMFTTPHRSDEGRHSSGGLIWRDCQPTSCTGPFPPLRTGPH